MTWTQVSDLISFGYWIQYSNVLLERVGIAVFVAIFFLAMKVGVWEKRVFTRHTALLENMFLSASLHDQHKYLWDSKMFSGD